jgi:hypothetical protein
MKSANATHRSTTAFSVFLASITVMGLSVCWKIKVFLRRLLFSSGKQIERKESKGDSEHANYVSSHSASPLNHYAYYEACKGPD